MTDTDRWAAAMANATHDAASAEARGALSDSTIDALVSAGAFRLWVPTAYGGGGTDLRTGLDAIGALARADGAAGWCVMIANTTALLSASLDASVAAALFGSDRSVCGGFAAPVGTARAAGRNAIVTGEWAWGSGSAHATTMGGGVRWVTADGTPGEGPDGSRVAFAFFPDGVELLDTWDVAGLSATASTDYRVTSAGVPLDHIVAMDRRRLVVDEPLYRFSTFGALALGVAMVLVGLAERAADELIAMGEHVPQGSGRGLADRPVVQAELARALGAARSSRAVIDDAVGQAWDEALTTGRVGDEHRVGLRIAAGTAAEQCRLAVDRCYHAAGGQAVYRRAPIQRVFRDAHVASQHAMIAGRVFEPLGRHAFGLPTDLSSL